MRFMMDAPPYTLIHDRGMIEAAVRRCLDSKFLAVDTETLGKPHTNMTDQVVWASFAPDEESRILVPRRFLEHFRPVLESAHIPKALTNIKFDAHRLANAGIDLRGPWADTVMMDFLVDEDTRENRHGLKPCMGDYFGIPMREYGDLFGKEDILKIKPGHPLWEKFIDYASMDAWATRKLALHLLKLLDEQTLGPDWGDLTLKDHYWDTEAPQLKTLYRMERRGVRVDTGRLQGLANQLQKEMDDIAAELCSMLGRPFNPGSADQIGTLLFDPVEGLGIPPIAKTPTGKFRTKEEDLIKVQKQYPDLAELNLIMSYRKRSKAKGTYAEGILKRMHTDGKVHTTFSATKTTGRLGSANPNMQNIPSPDKDPYRFRSAFIPDDGMVMLSADYSQIEIRLLAYMAGEEPMMQAIREGLDVHSFTASKIHGIPYDEFMRRLKAGDGDIKSKRSGTKAVNFGLAYGQTEYGLSEKLGCTKGRALEIMNDYFRTFPGVRRYINETKAKAKKYGYVQTIVGRFRRLSALNHRSWIKRHHAENQAINTPIQGSAADIVKKAMIAVDTDAELADLGFQLLVPVHDELMGQVPKENAQRAFKIMTGLMEHPFVNPLPVPLTTDGVASATNWADCK